MRKIILNIATSEDNKIAKSNGDTSWLHTKKIDYTNFKNFLNTIDVIIMGENTFKESIKNMKIYNNEKWFFEKYHTYVFGKGVNTKFITFVDNSPKVFIKKLRENKGKDIWLMGGAELIESFSKENLIDEVIITKMKNVILGEGIDLWKSINLTKKMKLFSKEDLINFEQLWYKK